MNLIELYNALAVPEEWNEKILNANQIPDYPDFRIAASAEGCPVLLLKVANPIGRSFLKNVRLKYFQLTQNVECKITQDGVTDFQTFTVISFTGTDWNLKEYFLRVSEAFIKALSTRPTQNQVFETINQFVEVFRALGDPPIKSIHGLWSELFLIESSQNPHALLTYWHNLPEEKFDFNSGKEKIEVKSNSAFERVHTFSSEQLNPPEDTQALIASVFITQSSLGNTIQELIDSIISKVFRDLQLIEKLNATISRTLGNSLEQSIKIKFNYQVAKDSLRFYRHQDIHKIERLSIPNEVSEVRFKSDLSSLKDVSPSDFNDGVGLFKSI